MSSYSELIKNFEKIRAYMREFYVYGFKSRDDYQKKSARSYDDERRRLESWLGDHMSFVRTPEGKNVFISIDSRTIRHNPLYNAWKAKSFTDGDITLYFILFDILHDPGVKRTIAQLLDEIDKNAAIADKPRPAHADFTAHVKYGGANDVRGGGHFSGRLTAPLCFAGAVCAQILARRGVTIGAHAATIGMTFDESFDPLTVTADALRAVSANPFPTISDASAQAMLAEIADAKSRGDSLGGVIECFAVGLPVGLGEPMFGGVEGRIAEAIFGIPAVKGLEFGSGFYGSTLPGSENNDPFTMDGDRIVTTSNHHGGILGGITSGMPLVLRAAIKPTPTLMQEQQTVSLSAGENAILPPKGRHDPCIVPRAVPVIEAAVAAVLLDLWLESGNFVRGV